MAATKRVRLTTEQKIEKLQGSSRQGLEELSLELVKQFPDLKLSDKKMRNLLEAFLDIIVNSLHTGRPVMLPGFGSFQIKERGARRVRNPREKEGPNAFKEVGPSTSFKFKPGSSLKSIQR